MAYKTISPESAYRIGLWVERAKCARAQVDLASVQARQATIQAEQIMRSLGLDPARHQIVVDEGTVIAGVPVPIGTILQFGVPVEEQQDESQQPSVDAADS